MNSLLFVTFAIVSVLVVEFIKRSNYLESNDTRRLIHVVAAIINFFAPVYALKIEIILINLGFLGLFLLLQKKKSLASLYGVSRTTYGDIFFLLGIIVSAFVFLPQNIIFYQFGILVMGISDPIASFIGQKFGKKLLLNKKTIEGSIAFFLSTIILGLWFFPSFIASVIVISIILTVIEMSSPYGLDNFTLPISASILAKLMIM